MVGESNMSRLASFVSPFQATSETAKKDHVSVCMCLIKLSFEASCTLFLFSFMHGVNR